MNDLNSYFPISPEQIAQFRRDGFIKLKNVLSAETLAHYGKEIASLTLALHEPAEPLAQSNSCAPTSLQAMNLWERSAVVAEFVLGRRLGSIAAHLLEVGGVRLYHDQAIYKEPGGGAAATHADQYGWPFASDRCVTVWVPLQAVPEEMGPLGFFARSQTVAFGRDLGVAGQSQERVDASLAQHSFAFVEGAYDLGDVSFHLGWTFHRAGPNRSSAPRIVMTMIYMDADMKLAQSLDPVQASHRARWCPGSVPGATVATSKNPLIYRAH
jgi:ectoine hydroxylase-related dioxygenase (phytanoyl-CoA dioxygenase family)